MQTGAGFHFHQTPDKAAAGRVEIGHSDQQRGPLDMGPSLAKERMFHSGTVVQLAIYDEGTFKKAQSKK